MRVRFVLLESVKPKLVETKHLQLVPQFNSNTNTILTKVNGIKQIQIQFFSKSKLKTTSHKYNFLTLQFQTILQTNLNLD
jgi:hypothetical protein